eukprot:10381375-Ditylum_brightwellii.AAC.1
MAKTICDLVQLQFLFLLQVREYTLPAGNRQNLTIQFRRRDVCFHKNGQVLDHKKNNANLAEADAVTLILTNQKNSKENAILHHHTSCTDICPVKCTAQLITRMMQVSEDHDMPLCAYDKQNRQWCTVKDRHITDAVKFAVTGCGLLEKGYKLAK